GAARDDVQHLLVLQVADAVRTVGRNKFPPLCLLAVLFLHRDCAVLGSGQQLAGNRDDAVLFGLKDSHNRPLLSKTKKAGESSMISALSPTLFYYSQLSQKCQTISSKRSAFGYSESKSHPQVPQICCACCSARTSSSRFS